GLKHRHGIDALVALPSGRLLDQDLQGLAGGGLIRWTRPRYVRTAQGHKERRVVAVASSGGWSSWDSFPQAAAQYGIAGARLWGCLIREVEPEDGPVAQAMARVSTRPWATGFEARLGFRPRGHVGADNFRELKGGWGREGRRWGRDADVARGRVALTGLAF